MLDSRFVIAVVKSFPRRTHIYGIYVVCIETIEGCRGGGRGLLRTNKGFGTEAVRVREAIERLKLVMALEKK